MLAFLLPLLGGWWGAFRWSIIAGAVIAVTVLVHNYSSRGEEIVALKAANSAFEHQVTVLKANAVLLKSAVDVVDGRLSTMFLDLDVSCAMLDAVKKDTSPDADKPVSNPIGSVLDRIGRGKK